MKDVERIKKRIERVYNKQVLKKVMARSGVNPQVKDLQAALDQVLSEEHVSANNSADTLEFDNDLVVL